MTSSRPTSIKLSQVSSSRSPPPEPLTPIKRLKQSLPAISPPPPSPRTHAFQQLFDTPDSIKRRFIKCNHHNFSKRYPRYSKADLGELIYSAVNRKPYQRNYEDTRDINSFRSYKEFQNYSSQSIDQVLEPTLTNLENSKSQQEIGDSVVVLEAQASVVSKAGHSSTVSRRKPTLNVKLLRLEYTPILGDIDGGNSPKPGTVKHSKIEQKQHPEDFRSEDTSLISIFPDVPKLSSNRKAAALIGQSQYSSREKNNSLDQSSMSIPRLLSKLKSVKQHLSKDVDLKQGISQHRPNMKDIGISGTSAIYLPKKELHIKKSHSRQPSVLQEAFTEANMSQVSVANIITEPRSALLPSVSSKSRPKLARFRRGLEQQDS